jgi:hypothetical protein
MSSRSASFVRFPFLVVALAALAFLFGETLGTGFAAEAYGQDISGGTAAPYSLKREESREINHPYRRDNLSSNWNRRGRTVPGESPAALRLKAYRHKMAMRAERAAASARQPNSASSAAVWQSLGPSPLASDATGNGMQDYNWVSGRATSVLIDRADSTGNTVLLGGAYGGLWRSTNAGSASSDPASVTWQALIDDQPTLAVGAIALQPVASGNSSNLILVGTGETNSSGDSYYGLGILRSIDSGATWTQTQAAASGQSFLGVGFSEIAFSTANSNLVVAATGGDNGFYLGREQDANSTARGLYFSSKRGQLGIASSCQTAPFPRLQHPWSTTPIRERPGPFTPLSGGMGSTHLPTDSIFHGSPLNRRRALYQPIVLLAQMRSLVSSIEERSR